MYYIVFQVLLIALFCVWCHPRISRIYTYYFIIFHPGWKSARNRKRIGFRNNLYSKMKISLLLPFYNYFFSTEEKPKKRNEKECPSRLTELREVCQGLRWKYSFCGATAESKRKIFRCNPQGLTFTNNWNGVIFAFNFYFFWR